MKKLATIVILWCMSFQVYGQKSIDLGIIIWGPLTIYSDSVTGTTPIPLNLGCKNYGNDTVFKGDTVLWNASLVDRFDQSLEADFPEGALTVGKSYVLVADKDYVMGDTMHINNELTFNKITIDSREMLLGGSCVIRRSQGDSVVDPKLRNNTWFRFCRWYNASQARVSVVSVTHNPYKVYPTPASDNLYIDVGNETNIATVTVTNSLGQMVYSKVVQPSITRHTIDVGEFEDGIYVVKMLNNAGGYVTQRVVIQH